ncbi:MAG: undecaprenyl-diphosphate phosphatase [Fuerstiella sp.]
MEYIHAAILGLVQGIAEFLPISSSGHLVIADALLHQFSGGSVPQESATMGIALHFGTLLSILVVLRSDLIKLLSDRRTILMIVIATIPVGIIGVLLKDYVDAAFNSPLVAGIALLITAAFLMTGRWLQNNASQLTSVNTGAAVAIGLFQAVAIVPGISRSGSTIAAGMACGLKREDAARFSFLIAIPAIGGAAVVQLKDILTGEEQFTGAPAAILFGTLIAFLVGVVALKWLLKLVVADKIHWFAMYCLVVGLLTIVWQISFRTGSSIP